MMSVVTMAQAKGGVGKSTLAICLAAEASRKGWRTIIVELDDRTHLGTATQWANERRASAADNDLLKPVDKAKVPPEVERIEPQSLQLALAGFEKRGIRLVIIDLPGSAAVAVNPAIAAADLVLIPSQPQGVDLKTSQATIDVVVRAQRPYAYVLAMVAPSGDETQKARDALEAEGHTVAPQAIKAAKAYYRAIESGQTVQELDPNGKPAGEIRSLWNWVQQQLEAKKKHEQRKAV